MIYSLLRLLFVAAVLVVSTSSPSVVVATTTTNWNCFAKMIISQIALDNLPTSSSSSKQQDRINTLQDAIDYQLMSSGLSTFPELACWSSNITSVLELHQHQHQQQQQNFTQNQYSEWQRSVHCYGSKCPSDFKVEGDLVDVLGEAIAGAKKAMLQETSSSSTSSSYLVQGASPIATLGFWISMISEIVASAHNPLQVCTLINEQFPPSSGGDDSGQKFFIRYGGTTTASEISLSSFVSSAAALLEDANSDLRHPILDFPEQTSRLNLYSNSLQKDLGHRVSPTERANTDVNRWIASSRFVCEENVYAKGTLVSGAPVSDKYVLQLRSALQRQLLVAGYHLASLLEKELVKF